MSHVVAPSDDFFHAVWSDVLSLRELEDLLLPIKDQGMRSEKEDFILKVGRSHSSKPKELTTRIKDYDPKAMLKIKN